ncbi:hypothetical protein [Halovivax cerinus]|uniref:Uncharacterized protein n=1 Tax=Halovivax cerinus TaxID=1487865 RepID=A0ABD5NQA9_9EURY|nr:hypothetical protein [Halovivax cerinus]
MAKTPNRRSVLSALGTAGSASLAGVTVEKGGAENERRTVRSSGREVVEWTGEKKKEVASTASNNKMVAAISNRLKQNGWVISDSKHRSGTVLAADGEEYDFGVLSFESVMESERQAAILWKRYKTGEWEVKGYVHSNSDNNSDSDVVITVDSTMNVRKIEYEGGATIETSCPCLDPGGGSDCVFFHDRYCVDFNLSCVLFVIGALGLSCGTAGAVGCLGAAGLGIAEYLAGDGCNICDEYTEDEVFLC